MNARRRMLARLGVVVGAVVAVLAVTGSQAFAASSVRGFGRANYGTLTSCQDVFNGRVTSENGNTTVASINDVTFSFCEAGTSMRPTALPWTLTVTESTGYTIEGFSVDITNSRGTCNYSGTISGNFQFPPGVYDLLGSLTRRTTGCGGPTEIFASGDQNIAFGD